MSTDIDQAATAASKALGTWIAAHADDYGHDLWEEFLDTQKAWVRKNKDQATNDARDAARYRWLRERDVDTISRGAVFAGVTPQNLVINLEHLDQHIDAAMTSSRFTSAVSAARQDD